MTTARKIFWQTLNCAKVGRDDKNINIYWNYTTLGCHSLCTEMSSKKEIYTGKSPHIQSLSAKWFTCSSTCKQNKYMTIKFTPYFRYSKITSFIALGIPSNQCMKGISSHFCCFIIQVPSVLKIAESL